MKTKLLSLFALLALLPGSLLLAADDPRVATLTAADDQRVAATLAVDKAKLGEILADDLRYAHSTGAVDTKAGLIEALVSGKTKYVAFDYEERKFTFPAPTIALMTGRTHIKAQTANGLVDSVLGYLGVWKEEAGKWHFLSWQSCKLPPPTPTAK